MSKELLIWSNLILSSAWKCFVATNQLVRSQAMSQVRKAKTDCDTSTDFTIYIIDWAVCVRSDILI